MPIVIHSPNTPKLTVVQARCQALRERWLTDTARAFIVFRDGGAEQALVGTQGGKQKEHRGSFLALPRLPSVPLELLEIRVQQPGLPNAPGLVALCRRARVKEAP